LYLKISQNQGMSSSIAVVSYISIDGNCSVLISYSTN